MFRIIVFVLIAYLTIRGHERRINWDVCLPTYDL